MTSLLRAHHREAAPSRRLLHYVHLPEPAATALDGRGLPHRVRWFVGSASPPHMQPRALSPATELAGRPLGAGSSTAAWRRSHARKQSTIRGQAFYHEEFTSALSKNIATTYMEYGWNERRRMNGTVVAWQRSTASTSWCSGRRRCTTYGREEKNNIYCVNKLAL